MAEGLNTRLERNSGELMYDTRSLSKRLRDAFAKEEVVLMTMLGFGAMLLALPDWVPVRMAHAPILLAIAVTGSIGQYAITEAFRHAQAAVAAPFEYTALAWGLGLDWWLWQTLPDRWVFAGAAIIVASGLYLLRHERRHAVAEHP